MSNFMILERKKDLQQLAAKSGIGDDSGIFSEKKSYYDKKKVGN